MLSAHAPYDCPNVTLTRSPIHVGHRPDIQDILSGLATAGISSSRTQNHAEAGVFKIGNRQFSDKAAAIREVRRILHGHGRSIAAPENQQLIVDLLAQHPEGFAKRGPAFRRIDIVKSEEGYNAFAAVQADGSPIIFSFKKCFGYVKSPEERLAEAARNAVEHQLLSFKQKSSRPGSSFVASHVQHLDLQDLIAGWLQQEDMELKKVLVDDLNAGGFPKYRMTQHDQLVSWQDYHEAHAELEVISTAEFERRRVAAYRQAPVHAWQQG